MELPLQITFRNMETSPAVEANVREKMAKLERFFSHVVSCRVTIEQENRNHHKGNLFRVAIDIKVPDGEFVANRTPANHHSHTDVYVAIRDAFDAVKRQLEAYADKRKGKTKTHETPAHGRVTRLDPENGYGYILTPDGREIYFHQNSVVDTAFNKLAVGAEVRFAESVGDEGPQASTVHTVGKHHVVG